MGTLPMAQNAVTRQKEQRLRETLREIRSAIDEFKRDTYGACAQGASTTSNSTTPNQGAAADPRSRVYIDDCKIFGIENLDRYPPSLEILVKGVRVKSRVPNLAGGSGLNNNSPQATEINQEKEVNKVYLREIPIDPMTGEAEWKLRSSYQEVDSDSWDDVNVFDVRTTSKGEALNGEKYSDW